MSDVTKVERVARLLAVQADIDPDGGAKTGVSWINFEQRAREIVSAMGGDARALALEEAAKWLDDWSDATMGQDVSPSYAADAIRSLSTHPTPTPEQRAGQEVDAEEVTSSNEIDHTAQYTLKWIAAPRPPVHPKPMAGRQTFNSMERAVAFFERQPDDAEFVSLTQIMTRTLDRSDDFRAIAARKGGTE